MLDFPSKEKAQAIRELYATGNHTHKQLGEMFGVSKTMAGLIVRERFWT